jgi:hypothetical protein
VGVVRDASHAADPFKSHGSFLLSDIFFQQQQKDGKEQNNKLEGAAEWNGSVWF